MKKMLFSALAVVAFAGSALASNGSKIVVESVDQIEATKPCNIFISVVDRFGKKDMIKGEGGNTSLKDCESYMNDFIKSSRERGFIFDSDKDVTLIWG